MSEKKQNKEVSVLPLTTAQKLWEEIKNKKIDMFSLPNQKVSDYCSVVDADPEKLMITIKVSSTLPALESALGPDWSIEMAGKFYLISKKV